MAPRRDRRSPRASFASSRRRASGSSSACPAAIPDASSTRSHDSREIQTILVRHEQVGSIMAEMYGRLTGKPGVVMGQGIFLACNALFGTLEAVKGASPMLLLGDFTDMAPFMHHAPYQAGTGEHGNHDLRNLLASATKYTAAVSEPKQAVQTLQLAIKHATTGTPGPVAVVFASRSLGRHREDAPAAAPARDRAPSGARHGSARRRRRRARRRGAPRLVEPGDPRRQRRPRLARVGGARRAGRAPRRFRWRRRPRGRARSPRCIRWRSGSSATGDRPWPTRWSRRPTRCSWSARGWRRPTRASRTPSCSTPTARRFFQIDVEPLNVGRHLPGEGRDRRRRARGARGSGRRARPAAHARAREAAARRAPGAPGRAQDPASLLRRARAALGRRPAPARAGDHRARHGGSTSARSSRWTPAPIAST